MDLCSTGKGKKILASISKIQNMINQSLDTCLIGVQFVSPAEKTVSLIGCGLIMKQ